MGRTHINYIVKFCNLNNCIKIHTDWAQLKFVAKPTFSKWVPDGVHCANYSWVPCGLQVSLLGSIWVAHLGPICQPMQLYASVPHMLCFAVSSCSCEYHENSTKLCFCLHDTHLGSKWYICSTSCPVKAHMGQTYLCCWVIVKIIWPNIKLCLAHTTKYLFCLSLNAIGILYSIMSKLN